MSFEEKQPYIFLSLVLNPFDIFFAVSLFLSLMSCPIEWKRMYWRPFDFVYWFYYLFFCVGMDSEPYVSLECIWIIFKKNLSANESPKINLRVLRCKSLWTKKHFSWMYNKILFSKKIMDLSVSSIDCLKRVLKNFGWYLQ